MIIEKVLEEKNVPPKYKIFMKSLVKIFRKKKNCTLNIRLFLSLYTVQNMSP